MAEVRKFEPESGDDLGRLVREALGETVHPTQPGGLPAATSAATPDEPVEAPAVASVPIWGGDAEGTIRFEF